MKTITIVLLTALCVVRCSAQSGWFELSSGTTKDLHDVAFISADTGFVVGADGVAIRTTNGGSNWHQMTLPSKVFEHLDLVNIRFISPSIGFMSILYGTILRTSNGGDSWAVVQEGSGNLLAFDFPTATIGYAAGYTDYDTSSYLMKTTDGGLTWEMLPMILWRLNSVSFSDQNNGLAAASTKHNANMRSILRTTDGGLTWIDLKHPAGTYPDGKDDTSDIWSVKYVPGNGWFAGMRYSSYENNGIYKSTNDGTSWVKVDTNSTRPFGFFDSQVGYALGGRELTYETIRKTTDGGSTWFHQPIPKPIGGYSGGIAVPTVLTAYAVGQNGVILKTVDGGGTPLSVEALPHKSDAILRIVNDVSTEHARCIYLDSGELRRLLVYDLLGQIVLSLAVEPETTSLDLDTSTLPSGTYWCRLGDETARFVVVR
jgi:photosystem II stability/assembly factor-like uncharacterized protein